MAHFSTFGKKAAAAALVALTLGAGMTAVSGEAEARYGRKGLIAAGIGALAVGALIAGSQRSYAAPGYYAEPGPVYYNAPQRHYYAPAYYDPAPGYAYGGPVCRLQKQRVWLSEDTYTIRKVRVCR